MPFARLIKIMETLRGQCGCPWDKEQTHDSLKPYLIEESYELLEALDEGKPERIKEELGDLLFQIIFHSQISKELGQFDINDVIAGITEKMIRRHPHVFGNKKLRTSKEVIDSWQEHKKREGKGYESAISGVPRALPALLRAHELQKKATRVGFDWENIEDVFKKLDEEIKEFRCALKKKGQKDIEDEIGDIFFVLVRISNFVGVNPEDALRKTISKFIRRFRYIEMKAKEIGKRLPDMTLEEMELFWQEAKKGRSQ